MLSDDKSTIVLDWVGYLIKVSSDECNCFVFELGAGPYVLSGTS